MIKKGIFFVKDLAKSDGSLADLSTKWEGVSFLKVEGLTTKGKPKNIYIQSWTDSDVDDVAIPDKVYYEHKDITITFVVSDKEKDIDVSDTHSNVVEYLCSHKLLIQSSISKLKVTCAGNSEDYTPSVIRLGRTKGLNYILGSIKLNAVTNVSGI